MITDLITTLNQGARTNKYRIIIPISESDKIDTLVKETSFPSRTITPLEINIRGRKVSLRGDTNLENTIDITFYNTHNMKERKEILNWMDEVHKNQWNPEAGAFENIIGGISSMVSGVTNVIQNPLSLLSGVSPTYQKDITIEQIDYNGDATFRSVLIGAFPINVGNITLSSENGEISTTTVTFSYTDLKNEIDGELDFFRYY